MHLKHPAAPDFGARWASIAFDGDAGDTSGHGGMSIDEAVAETERSLLGDAVAAALGANGFAGTGKGVGMFGGMVGGLTALGQMAADAAERAGLSVQRGGDPGFGGGAMNGSFREGQNLTVSDMISAINGAAGGNSALLDEFATSDIAIGENLEKRITGRDALNFLARERLKQIYGTMKVDREGRGDDTPLRTDLLTADDRTFLDAIFTNPRLVYGRDMAIQGYRNDAVTNLEWEGVSGSPQSFLQKLPKILNDPNVLTFEATDRNFDGLDPTVAAEITRLSGHTGDLTREALDDYLVNSELDAETLARIRELDPRQNLAGRTGADLDFNQAVLSHFSDFNEDLGGGNFQRYLDASGRRAEFDAFKEAYYSGSGEGTSMTPSPVAHPSMNEQFVPGDASSFFPVGLPDMSEIFADVFKDWDPPTLDVGFEFDDFEMPKFAPATKDAEDRVGLDAVTRRLLLARQRKPEDTSFDATGGSGLVF